MKPLQNFEFNKSHYDRPSQKWVCGDKACGKECAKGPNTKGKCQTSHECIPYKDQDRWQCNRPLSQGGTCKSGPLANGTCCQQRPPCTPRLSKRFIRGRFVMVAILIGLGFFVAYFSGGEKSAFFSPGKLSSVHTQLQSECDTCHAEPPPSVQNSKVDIDEYNSAHNIQSTLCVDCHQFNNQSFTPHNLSFNKSLTHPINLNAVSDSAMNSIANNQDTSCGSCHEEHQGNVSLLGANNYSNCVTCHTDSNGSFANSHPEFEQVATNDTTKKSIKFSHKAHRDNYYIDAERENFACTQCHEIANTLSKITTKSFDDTCADCHHENVTGEQFDAGLILWSTPAIDLDRLIQPSNWPEDAVDEEAELSLIELWALQLMTGKVEAYDQLVHEDLDLSDLSEASPKVLQLVEQYMQESTEYLKTITRRGPATKKLPKVLLDVLPPNLTQLAHQQWFENKTSTNDDTTHYSDLTQGGSLQSSLTLQYRPSGHKDPVFKSITEYLIALPNKTVVETRLLAQMFDKETVGQCGKCHRPTASDLTHIWSSNIDKSRSALHEFNHFTHSKSLNKLECSECHQNNTRIEHVDFEGVEKQTCSQCHSQEKAGESCLLCHNYHAEPLTLTPK